LPNIYIYTITIYKLVFEVNLRETEETSCHDTGLAYNGCSRLF